MILREDQLIAQDEELRYSRYREPLCCRNFGIPCRRNRLTLFDKGKLVVVLMWKGTDVVFISAEYSDVNLLPRKERSDLNDENFLLETEAMSFLPNSRIWKRISLKQQSWAIEVTPSVVAFNDVFIWIKHDADLGIVSKLRIIVRHPLYILEVFSSKIGFWYRVHSMILLQLNAT